jgi:hypothetical protein
VKAIGGALMLTIRFIVWVFDLDDGSGAVDWRKASPSATKIWATAIVAVALWTIIANCRAPAPAICGTNAALNILIIAAVSALFGRAMWKAFLLRNQINQSAAASASVAYERKDLNTKTDVHFTVDGSGASVPAISLPPNPAARTPSGDD